MAAVHGFLCARLAVAALEREPERHVTIQCDTKPVEQGPDGRRVYRADGIQRRAECRCRAPNIREQFVAEQACRRCVTGDRVEGLGNAPPRGHAFN